MIEYVYCSGEMIDGVQLVQVVGKDPTIADADDPVLWEITADEERQSGHPSPTRIILGGSVRGFTEAIPLTGALQAGVPYAVLIESSQSRFGGSATFEIDELETDRILSAGRHLSEEEFAKRGKQKCRELNPGSASDAARAAA